MTVTLKIISYQRLTPGQQESFQTELERFSIGRRPENHWPLPDPQRFMSGTHCWLENRNGTWHVTDTSTNGVFINGSDQRVNKNDSVPLNDGDRIRVGDYELELHLEGGASAGIATEIPSDPFIDDGDEIFSDIATDFPPASQPNAPQDLKEVNTPLAQMDSGLLGESVSIDDLYELDEEEQAPEPPPSLASQGNQVSPMRQHFTAPEVAPQAPGGTQGQSGDDLLGKYAAELDEIPENWDDDPSLVTESPVSAPPVTPPAAPDETATISSAPAVSPPAPEPPPAPLQAAPPPVEQPPSPRVQKSTPSSPALHADSALAAFAKGAGLDLGLLQVPDEEAFFEDLGALLKTMTEGLMQAIASRGQVKSEFRLEQTMIAPTENNPFKFSVSAQEAMMRLIHRTDGAYLSGIAAASEAVDDINAHQLAVMAGTEAALKSILRRFDPEKMEKKFSDESSLSKAVPVLKKARYWEFYKVLYTEISEAVDDDFQQLFGAEFSNAYEQQLDRLKLSRKESS